jgi:outer membrane lipoprotein SlyB
MKILNRLAAALAVIGILALAGCGGGGLFGSDSETTTPAAGIKAGAAAAGTGVVQSIEPVQQDGKTIQRFTVRMDGSGSRQTITNASASGFRVGDRVRIENGMMRKN